MKPIILVLAEVYLPGYLAGGPVRSLAGLVEHLGGDFDWWILTTNRDFRTSVPYSDIPPDRRVRMGEAHVWYASAGRDRASDLLAVIRKTPHDLLYLNSFFSPRFAVGPALARRVGLLPRRPVLIAPRGEFSIGALRIKARKKAAYLRIARALGTYADVYWQASTPHEKSDIECRMQPEVSQRILESRNLSPARSQPQHEPRIEGAPLRVCFLSRICRMKNLDFALRALALTTRPVQFSIVGPKEDADYWAECASLIPDLPQHVEVIVSGAVSAAAVPTVLAGQDLLFLPTRGENYGHVLVEAWSAGLPVLTSDQTPWRGLEVKGIGWDLELGERSLSAFADKIDFLARLSVAELGKIREMALNYAAEIHNDQAAIDSNKNMFITAIRGVRIGVE